MRRAFFIVLTHSLLLAGCVLAPPQTLDPELLQHIPASAELEDTPFIQQADFQCGPASLAMVLNHQGYQVTPEALASQVFTPRAKGSFPVEMDITARRQGFVSYPVQDLNSLLREIAAGNPVLVLQNLSVSWYPQWHFAVVIGYDLKRNELILRSGDLPRRITPISVFDRTWERSDRWGRVLLPGSTLPATARPLAYIEVVNRLEQSGHRDQALTAYRSAGQKWPQSAVVRFALANALLAANQVEAALVEYQALLDLDPALVAGWNNLAYALKAAGCYSQAVTAATCATHLAPTDDNVRDTLAEMSQLPDKRQSQRCPALACP